MHAFISQCHMYVISMHLWSIDQCLSFCPSWSFYTSEPHVCIYPPYPLSVSVSIDKATKTICRWFNRTERETGYLQNACISQSIMRFLSFGRLGAHSHCAEKELGDNFNEGPEGVICVSLCLTESQRNEKLSFEESKLMSRKVDGRRCRSQTCFVVVWSSLA